MLTLRFQTISTARKRYVRYTRPENSAKNGIRPHMHMYTAFFIIEILLSIGIELVQIIARDTAACQYFSHLRHS